MKKKILFVATLFLLCNCEAIFVENISEETIVLLAPTNTSEVISGTIQFNWQELAEAIEYEVQIAKPNFANASQILLDSLTTAAVILKDLEVGAYEWRVKALNSGYITNYSTNSFLVLDADFEDKIIPLLLPVDKDTTNVKIQSLSWETLDGASEYRVQIWQPDVNGTKLLEEVITTTNYEYEFLEGDFTWQVRAENSLLNTAFSARTITVDATLPNTPELSLPDADISIATNTAIEFEWNRSDILGTPELDSIYFYSEVSLQTLVHKDQGASLQYTKDDFSIGDYYWVVKAFDTAGNEGLESTTRKFTIN
jgi:hypothetical protein